MLPGVSPATEAETWRSKAAQPSPQLPPPVKESATLPLLEQVDSFSISMDDSFEVVDFSEHGKLIGVTSPQLPVEDAEQALVKRSARPHAADFFQDQVDQPIQKESSAVVKVDEGSWRRKVSPVQELPTTVDQLPEKPRLQIAPAPYQVHHDEQDRRLKEHGQPHPSHNPSSLKSPVTSSYREAPMSALNDTMARIKGALDGMHKPAPNLKWLPPALRPRQAYEERFDGHELEEYQEREVFDTTGGDPPRSPKPAWSHFTVKVPRASRHREATPPERLRGSMTYGRGQLEVLSLASYGNSRRLFQLTEILFPQQIVRERREYKVSIPKPSRSRVTENGLVVNLPALPRSAKSPSAGAFGRPREADGLSSWRKPASSPPKEKDSKEISYGLDTVSRSPPPEPSVPLPRSAVTAPSSPTVSVPTKGKAPSKVINGSAIPFYRDSRVSSSDNAVPGSVKFIVSSELDEEPPSRDNKITGRLPAFAKSLPGSVGESHASNASPVENKIEACVQSVYCIARFRY